MTSGPLVATLTQLEGVDQLLIAYNVDARTLLSAFYDKRTTSFCEFRSTWRTLNFTDIHYARRHGDSQAAFMHTLYRTFIGYLFVEQPLEIRAAVLYSLYLLYETQISSPKSKIPVSLQMWGKILEVVRDVHAHRLPEPYQIFHRLYQKSAFLFSMGCSSPFVGTTEEEISPHLHKSTHATGNNDTLTGIIDYQSLCKVHAAYLNARQNHISNSGLVLQEGEHFRPLTVCKNDFPEEIRSVYEEFHKAQEIHRESVRELEKARFEEELQKKEDEARLAAKSASKSQSCESEHSLLTPVVEEPQVRKTRKRKRMGRPAEEEKVKKKEELLRSKERDPDSANLDLR